MKTKKNNSINRFIIEKMVSWASYFQDRSKFKCKLLMKIMINYNDYLCKVRRTEAEYMKVWLKEIVLC